VLTAASHHLVVIIGRIALSFAMHDTGSEPLEFASARLVAFTSVNIFAFLLATPLSIPRIVRPAATPVSHLARPATPPRVAKAIGSPDHDIAVLVLLFEGVAGGVQDTTRSAFAGELSPLLWDFEWDVLIPSQFFVGEEN
jgi:hypothetical protein